MGAALLYIDSAGAFDEVLVAMAARRMMRRMKTKPSALRVFGEFDTGAVTHEISASYFDIDRVSYATHWSGSPLVATEFDGKRKTIGYKATYQENETYALDLWS